MSQIIENQKNYNAQELDNIFLRPSFTGDNAVALGIKVMYGLAQNTTLNFFKRNSGILKPFADGFQGGTASSKYQKTIEMKKIKAEQKFSASDYFATIYQKIVADGNVNLQDISGTDLERAEVELFREAIAEDSRVAMWIGDTAGSISDVTVYDGFLKKASTYADAPKVNISAPTKSNIISLFKKVWASASKTLTALKSTGKVAFFVTSDVYEAYEEYLDAYTNTVAYGELQKGRTALNYQGVEVIKINAEDGLKTQQSIILLSHKDNLVFAVNTSDLPGADVRMWYNPDENQNRQRATFLAGTEILDESLIVYGSTEVAA